MTSFLGMNVNIKCESAGFYQGRIKEVDSNAQTITIEKPFHNGVRSNFSEITLSSNNIDDITIIEDMDDNEGKFDTPTVNVGKSQYGNFQRGDFIDQKSQRNMQHSPSIMSPVKGTNTYKNQQQHQYSKGRGAGYHSGGRVFNRDECFNIDQSEMNTDFDFEKNLALFDKMAVYDEIDQSSGNHQSKARRTESKYRHDENVLRAAPVIYRQIITKEANSNTVPEYYTDNGLVVPTVSSKVNANIMRTAENLGFSKTRQLELFGLNASQMSLTMVGGSNRLHPRNAHQAPHIVVLCGPHDTGAKGVATARHLSNQNVNVCVFLADFVKITECLQGELKLLSLTHATLINKTNELPTTPIDLVILAMDSEDCLFLRKQAWHKSVVDWCNHTMAPVLCLCPPSNLETPEISVKWCVCDGLPFSLDSRYGAIYMLDTGLPFRAFEQIGIKYKSPFCSKTSIALHRSKT